MGRYQKKWRKLLLIFLCFPLFISCGPRVRSIPIEEKQSYEKEPEYISESPMLPSVGPVGELPEELSSSLVENSVYAQGIHVVGGYLKMDYLEDGFEVSKYSGEGELIWSNFYEYGFGSYAMTDLVADKEGGFVVGISPFTYYTKEDHKNTFPSVVYRCDSKGNLVWKVELPRQRDGAIQYCFITEQNEVLTVGLISEETDRDEQKSNLVLNKISSRGKLKDTRIYGGSVYDSPSRADYAPELGLAVNIISESSDGDFEPYGKELVAVFGDDLELKWAETISEDTENRYVEGMLATEDGVYLATMDMPETDMQIARHDVKKYTENGEISWMREFDLPMPQGFLSFFGQTTEGVMIYDGTDLFRISANGAESGRCFFDAGYPVRLLIFENGYLVVSTNLIEMPDENNSANAITRMETVYSGYDWMGKMIWRDSREYRG